MMRRGYVRCAGLLALLGPGCAALNPRPPVEEFAAKFADRVVIPAVSSGIEQGIRAWQVQAGAQGINPTYVVEFEGKWVVGIEGRASVGVEGLAGQVQVATLGPATSRPAEAEVVSVE